MTKIFLKVCLLFVLMSVACGTVFAQNSDITAELDENGVLTVTAKTEELPGTKVSWMIIKPDKDIDGVKKDSIASEEDKAENIIHYMNTTEVSGEKTVGFTYHFTEDSKSGKYIVRLKIHGENEVRECTVYYTDKKALQKAADELNGGADVKDVLDRYIKDIDYDAGEKYSGYSEKEKQYVVDFVSDPKPDTAEKLKESVCMAVGNIEILAKLKTASKTEYKECFEQNIERLGIDKTKNYSDYKNMSDSKKEKVYVRLMEKTKSLSTPKELCTAFEEIVEEVKNENDTSKGSTTGGSKGGGSGSAGGFNPIHDITEIKPDEKTVYFDDLEKSQWAEKAINTLAEKKIINGIGESKFAPDKPITREAFVRIIVNAFELEMNGEHDEFEDVARDAWYYDAVMTAASCGIINGKSKTVFGTGENITRQDMAVIILRACEYARVGVYTVDMDASFNDMEDVSDYAKAAVEKMAKAKIINGTGDGKFEPKGNATRAQAAQIIYNVLF